MKKLPRTTAPERSDEDVLAPDIRLSLANGESVVIRELRWQQTRAFIQWLGDRLSRVVSAAAGGESALFDQLGAELGMELLEKLALEATGKDAAWIGGLSNSDALKVMSAALERNLTPELFSRGKEVAERLKGVLSSAPPTAS